MTLIAMLCGAALACTAPDVQTGTTRSRIETENGIDWNGIDWNGIDWNGIDWNGIDWNGIDWNGIDWNGIDWNGIDWNGIDWNGIDWNGIGWSSLDGADPGESDVDWNAIDWTGADWNAVPWQRIASVDWTAVDWDAVQLVDVLGRHGNVVRVHPRARPLFMFVRARAGELEIPLAIPSPGALRMIASAPDRAMVIHFLQKSWQIAYGAGFWLYLGRHDLDGDGAPEPIVSEGRLGLAPSLAGFGPYVEPQVAAWSSVIGNLLNLHPFELSLRAHNVVAMAASSAELARYYITDLRGAIGRIIPPPDDARQEPILVLFRGRVPLRMISVGFEGSTQDQLDKRLACSLAFGGTWAHCANGVTVVQESEARSRGLGGCDGVALGGPYGGTVTGRCWIDLPHVTYEQNAAEAPITGSFVDTRTTPCTGCGAQPL